MIDMLSYIAIVGLAVQAFIGLAFLISSVWEKEKRATIFGGIQFLGMLGLLVLFTYWQAGGFFATDIGTIVLIIFFIAAVGGAVACVRRTPANQRALKGTNGLIVGDVERFDESRHVFAR
ncbi:MAG: hypothetical protein PVI71_10415, partial [Desulfobacterales bacterium]